MNAREHAELASSCTEAAQAASDQEDIDTSIRLAQVAQAHATTAIALRLTDGHSGVEIMSEGRVREIVDAVLAESGQRARHLSPVGDGR